MGALYRAFVVERGSSVGHVLSAPVRSGASIPREFDVALKQFILGRACLSGYSEATRDKMASGRLTHESLSFWA